MEWAQSVDCDLRFVKRFPIQWTSGWEQFKTHEITTQPIGVMNQFTTYLRSIVKEVTLYKLKLGEIIFETIIITGMSTYLIAGLLTLWAFQVSMGWVQWDDRNLSCGFCNTRFLLHKSARFEQFSATQIDLNKHVANPEQIRAQEIER